MTTLIPEILHEIKPGKEQQQRFIKVCHSFLQKLNSCLRDAKAILGGSGAKGTWLAENYDIDIFVLYQYQKHKTKSQQLSDLLLPALKKAFPQQKILRLHGSRDYFQLPYQQHTFEIVPILNINKAEQAVNITDVSPLHARWVLKHGKKLRDDILLAKQFCKANRCYGAESYLGGFSGYVLEILIIHYGSFQKLLQASQKWKEKEVIDTEHYYPKKDALFHLNKSKTQSPLIVIDPVDKSRNAAAALTREKWTLFRTKVQAYLQKPSASFFERWEMTLSKLKKECGKKYGVYITLQTVPGKPDVMGAKLLKLFHFLEEKVKPFHLLKSGWEESGIFYFILQKNQLPRYEIRAGPPPRLASFVADFKKKNKKTFEEKGRLWAQVPNPAPTIKQAVEAALQHPYAKEKYSKVLQVHIFP